MLAFPELCILIENFTYYWNYEIILERL